MILQNFFCTTHIVVSLSKLPAQLKSGHHFGGNGMTEHEPLGTMEKWGNCPLVSSFTQRRLIPNLKLQIRSAPLTQEGSRAVVELCAGEADYTMGAVFNVASIY